MCAEGVGRGREFSCLLYRPYVCNAPLGCRSGEYCSLFSLPITTVTKSLGFGDLEVEQEVWVGAVGVSQGS